MEASSKDKKSGYEADALRALARARKAMRGEGGDAPDPQETQYQLAAANVYASLELASALKSDAN